MDTPMDTQHLDVRGFVCVFVVFHALFCFSSEKHSDSGGALSLQQENRVGWGSSDPRGSAGRPAVPGRTVPADITAGAGLRLFLESLASWRGQWPGARPLRAALRPAAGLHGDRTEALWDPRGHLISIPETLSSIKEIPRGWKPCQDLGRTL